MVLRLCAAIRGVAIIFAYSCSAMAKLGIVNVHSGARGKSNATPHQRVFGADAVETTQDKIHCTDAKAYIDVTIIGTASMYDPFHPGYAEGGTETASGELYDPNAWTAAIQTSLRKTFGGICYGKDYTPAYALVEAAGKRAIVKINDVGPLEPGRVIDFNERTMRFFDPSLQRGILRTVRITPLPGDTWAPGPLMDET
jgi:peptidoglycan lytic transglycosylase